MAITVTEIKDPDAQLDYTISWADWLVAGDEIASIDWEVDDGLTVVDTDNTTTTATIWLSGGVKGSSYKVRCRVTTASTPPRIDDRTVVVTCAVR